MKVRAGYKQTDVGIIPDDWDVRPLKSMISISHGYAFASKHFAGHGPFRLTTPGHFFEEGGFREIGEKQKFYVGPVPKEYVLRPGDVIVAMTEQADGLLGSAAVIPDDWYLHNQRLGRLKALSPEIELGYLLFVFNSASYRAKVRETAAGTKVKHTSPEKLLRIPVCLPPVPEQRAIAAALSDVDALLEGLTRLIAKKRDLKQAAMQQLLTGETRLHGFDNRWEQVRLGDLFDFKNGLNKSKQFFGHGTPIVNYMDVFGGSGIHFADLKGRVSLTNVELKAFEVRKGDVFFTRTSETTEDVGVASVMLDVPIKTVFSGFVLRARPLNDRLNTRFKAYCFGSSFVRQQITSKASYTTRALTNGRILSEVLLPLPTLPEQAAIAAVLSDMDAELAALEARRDKTRALRQVMMQELLTGRTRLV